ncbi:cytochrome c-type biogenesis protein CcmH [Erythrobacteraceae bacterium CFH 75059]|uniref:cytochrome c-type biogenesis protein n=1 Tax=Qipengyuania thermophila TaxID=2509361 RepID=UPI001020A590|nr:cytochrome c-type biogenesis protein [Qipengyuania thermophila]TCD05519.1 cytochrome c-type biogenesis protein CcmH [Erythrobacteraceae bacterium CFH 75059]
MKWLAAALLCILPLPAAAQSAMPPAPLADRQLDDPRLEAAARELMHTLRCVMCQGQSIADSDAPMAGDMRHQVRSRIAAGESAEDVRAWLKARYGDYISYQPELNRVTWPLFAVPALLLLFAALVFFRRVRVAAKPRR